MKTHAGMGVEFEVFIINPDGSEYQVGKKQKNLLLDTGLDKIGAGKGVCQCFENAAVGTGTNPVLKDSGSITASQTTTTVTASAGIFAAGDVGALLKFDSGQEVYITAFTSSTVVTVSVSQTVASSLFTIWYVNQTGLQTESKRTNTYGSGASDNQSTFSTDTWTHQRVFIFAAEVGSVTYQEIGWSDIASAGANLFGRALFLSPPSLSVGQQLKVTMQLSVKWSPSSITSVADVGGGSGYSTAGNMMTESVLASVSSASASYVQNPSGSTGSPNGWMDPSFAASPSVVAFAILRGTITLNSAISSTSVPSNPAAGLYNPSSAAAASYTAKNFFRDVTYTFNLATANGADHYGICLGQRNWTLLFTSPQTKDSSHTLTFTVRYSWGRILVNV
jgi:hypothetical protein